MAGLDDVTTSEDSGLPPSTANAPAKKKAAVPNQAGLNEWVANPDFAKEREAKVRDYYQKQLDAINAKEQSIGERWGLNDLYAQFGAPTAEARAQMMGLRQKELETRKAGKKEGFEGLQNLDQMKQAVQTRQAFNEYLQGADYYAQLAGQAKDPKQKSLFERNAANLTKQAQYLDPQAFAGHMQQRQDSIMKVGPDTTALDFSTGTPKVIAQTGPKTSDIIANANLNAQYGINALGNRGVVMPGSSNTVSPGTGAPNAPGAPQPPAPKGGSEMSPATDSLGKSQIPPDHTAINMGSFEQKAPDIYRGKSRYEMAPIKERLEMDKKKNTDYSGVIGGIKSLDQMDILINRLLNNPEGLKSATGFGHSTAGFRSTDTRQADSDLEALRNLVSIKALADFKNAAGGVGAITEKEWPRFEGTFGNLASNQDVNEITKTLRSMKSELDTSRTGMVNAYSREYGRHQEGEALIAPKPFSVPKSLADQLPVGQEKSIQNPKTRETIWVVKDKDGTIKRVK